MIFLNYSLCGDETSIDGVIPASTNITDATMSNAVVDELYIRDRVIEDDNGFQVFIIIGGENCKPEDLLIIKSKKKVNNKIEIKIL